MNTPDITQDEKKLVLETILEILDFAKVRREISIYDYGVWRNSNYLNSDGQLVPHMSADWYVNKWYNHQKKQVNVYIGAAQLLIDPWNNKHPHYYVILTAQDLYTPNTQFVIGNAYPQRRTIISVIDLER